MLGGLFAGLAVRGGLGDLLAAFEAVAFAEPALSLDRGRGASWRGETEPALLPSSMLANTTAVK